MTAVHLRDALVPSALATKELTCLNATLHGVRYSLDGGLRLFIAHFPRVCVSKGCYHQLHVALVSRLRATVFDSIFLPIELVVGNAGLGRRTLSKE